MITIKKLETLIKKSFNVKHVYATNLYQNKTTPLTVSFFASNDFLGMSFRIVDIEMTKTGTIKKVICNKPPQKSLSGLVGQKFNFSCLRKNYQKVIYNRIKSDSYVEIVGFIKDGKVIKATSKTVTDYPFSKTYKINGVVRHSKSGPAIKTFQQVAKKYNKHVVSTEFSNNGDILKLALFYKIDGVDCQLRYEGFIGGTVLFNLSYNGKTLSLRHSEMTDLEASIKEMKSGKFSNLTKTQMVAQARDTNVYGILQTAPSVFEVKMGFNNFYSNKKVPKGTFVFEFDYANKTARLLGGTYSPKFVPKKLEIFNDKMKSL